MTEKINLLESAIPAALAAGKAILKVYGTDFAVEHKADASPLTLADRQAHRVIVDRLLPLSIPVLSEEGKEIPYAERRGWNLLWIVDPLDGTKEFVNRNGEFTVNIALVENHRPILGVIYVPVKDRLYFGLTSAGAYRLDNASSQLNPAQPRALFSALPANAVKLPAASAHRALFTIVGSRSHKTEALEEFVAQLTREKGDVSFISAGSSMKFCLVAEGTADIYPRMGPTMEWDTAAGQAIAESAGFAVLDHGRKTPLTYNKENLLNPWFIVQPDGVSEAGRF